jgi:hypothetical protein
MNALNNGDFNITGSFMKNGVPIGEGGSSALTFTFAGSDVSGGSVDLTGLTGMPASGAIPSARTLFVDGQDYTANASYNPTAQTIFAGLDGSETLITVKITF